jgi:hypothetical protein
LIDRLEVALDTLLNLGYRTPEECRSVVRLFGCFPEVHKLKEGPVAYFLTLENLSCQPEPAADEIATLFRPEFMPAELAGRSRRNVDNTPAACRERFRRTVENRLARLRATEGRLRTGRDVHHRSQVVDPKTMIADSTQANTFFRVDESPKPAGDEPDQVVSPSEPDVPSFPVTETSVATTTCVSGSDPLETGSEPSVPGAEAPGEPPERPSDGKFLVRRSAELMRLLGAEAATPQRPGGGPHPAGPPAGAGSGL